MRKIRCYATVLAALVPCRLVASGEAFQVLQQKGAAYTPLQVLVLLTALTLLPAIVMSITPFLRISVVLHFLRNALGTQSCPSNQVLLGMALFLTTIIMQPVAVQVYKEGWEPYENGRLSGKEAWASGSQPIKRFLVKYCSEKDLGLFLDIAKSPRPANLSQLDMTVVVPAYILSELRVAFQIGAVLFFPFLVIDLVVAGVTLSVGMVQLPPVMVSAPFKILLFVLVDGWNLIIGSLVRSFYSAG
jgi:flagellar biosynthetic protein FliP